MSTKFCALLVLRARVSLKMQTKKIGASQRFVLNPLINVVHKNLFHKIHRIIGSMIG